MFLTISTDTNIQYGIPYQTEDSYNCALEGCDDEGICRCSRITGVTFNKMDPTSAESFIKNYGSPKASEVEKALWYWYLKGQKFDSGDFDWLAEGDYYGEVLRSITPTVSLLNTWDTFDRANLEEKLQICLNSEYGYLSQTVLQKLAHGGNLEFNMVPRKKVHAAQAGTSQVDPKYRINSWGYTKKNPISHIQAVFVIEDGSNFRLIDGHHRFALWTSEKRIKVPVLVLK